METLDPRTGMFNMFVSTFLIRVLYERIGCE